MRNKSQQIILTIRIKSFSGQNFIFYLTIMISGQNFDLSHDYK